MYLLSWHDDRSVLEASLGGKMDAAELRVLGEEITDLLDDVEAETFTLLFDQSKAHSFDARALHEVDSIKDLCLKYGAHHIISVIEDERIKTTQMTSRIQMVMEGVERFVDQADINQFPKERKNKTHQSVLKAA